MTLCLNLLSLVTVAKTQTNCTEYLAMNWRFPWIEMHECSLVCFYLHDFQVNSFAFPLAKMSHIWQQNSILLQEVVFFPHSWEYKGIIQHSFGVTGNAWKKQYSWHPGIWCNPHCVSHKQMGPPVVVSSSQQSWKKQKQCILHYLLWKHPLHNGAGIHLHIRKHIKLPKTFITNRRQSIKTVLTSYRFQKDWFLCSQIEWTMK